MDFTSWNKENDSYQGNTARTELPHLPPGAYTLRWDQHRGLFFDKINMHYDQLIDLPSDEYDYVMKRINTFLSADTQQAFEDYGFLYKWNCLLHGVFGTGKTCIVARVSEKIIQKGGVVLFNPDPRLIGQAFKMIDDVQPNRTTMVIFEEFEGVLDKFENHMLSLLDGEIQKNNVVYMATTNYIEQIPARLKRPGRFATILEVKFPNADARKQYLTMKLKPQDQEEIPAWVRATAGLSIDELKETVLSVKCFKNTLEETVQRILDTRRRAKEVEKGQVPLHTEEMLDECEEMGEMECVEKSGG